MKKFIVLVLTAIFSFSLFAETVRVKNYGESIFNTYVFTGFPFDKYNPSLGDDLEIIVRNEAKFIANDQNNRGNQKYTVVGHSQGGLRVLAYASMIEQLAKSDSTYKKAYENLGGVITVSGIDQGLLALQGGFKPINSKINEDFDIIYNGIKAGFEVSSLVSLFNKIVNITIDNLDITSPESVRNYVLYDVFPGEVSFYLLKALRNEPQDSVKEIRDMMPNSAFINKNVMRTESYVKLVRDSSKDKLSLSIAYKQIKILKKIINIPYITTTVVPGYSYYTYVENYLKMSNSIPTLYIVGTKNNSLSLLKRDYDKDGSISKLENNAELLARLSMEGLSNAMEGGYAIHIAKSLTIPGLVTGSVGKAKKCKLAAEWFGNIDGEIAELLNSTTHDGLVATQSQSIPTSYHSNTFGEIKLNYNHAEIDPRTNTTVQENIKKIFSKIINQ